MNHSFLMGGQSIHVNMIHHLFGYKFCLKVLYHGILAWDGIFSMLCYIFCMKTSYLMCISNTVEHMARSAPSCDEHVWLNLPVNMAPMLRKKVHRSTWGNLPKLWLAYERLYWIQSGWSIYISMFNFGEYDNTFYWCFPLSTVDLFCINYF